MMSPIRSLWFLSVSLFLFSATAHGSDCTIPNAFAAGTPAVAAEVNANFASVETAVDDNDSRIAALESALTALQSTMAAQASTITTLQSENAQLQSDNTALSNRLASVEGNSVLDLDGVLTLGTDNSGYDVALFSGVNVQIVDGSNNTPNHSGTGNLVVGYNELRGSGDERTGSHNFVVGRFHNYTSYGGFVAGSRNSITSIYASVSGGNNNTASGVDSSVSGGFNNEASGFRSSVTGGGENVASGSYSSVSGGQRNVASGYSSKVSGGSGNTASHMYGQVSTCENCETSGDYDFTAQGIL